MYFPSPLPTTRLSITTSALPAIPSVKHIPSAPKHPIRGGKGKFTGKLGGVLEEEAEEIIAICRANDESNERTQPGSGLWAVLGREDISVWYLRPKVVVAKLRRNPISLRRHGSNATVLFHSATALVVTTTSGHHLLYSLVPSSRGKAAYILPGGEEGARSWPRGPGEGRDIIALTLRGEGERNRSFGDGITCTCSTSTSLLVAVMEPPSLRVFPYPRVLSSSMNAELSETKTLPIWEGLRPGIASLGKSQTILFKDWGWLVGEDITLSELIPIDSAPQSPSFNAFEPVHNAPPQAFIAITSEGSAYHVVYGPAPGSALATPAKEDNDPHFLFDVKRELADEAGQQDGLFCWTGYQFHQSGAGEASTAAVNLQMGLVAIGCENGITVVYSLDTAALFSLQSLAVSHVLSLRESLNSTASSLETGRVNCLAWTSDGYALAVGWCLGYSVWSVYGRLGSWSVAGSLADGYGVEGEKSDAFEDHFMNGVRSLFWGLGNLELFVLCPPPAQPKGKAHDEQLFVIPFVKSAVAGLHSPDNTKHAFLQMDDRLLVYRGADQPDMSVINPESDVWQHIKIPAAYIAMQHPITYAVISSDARLIAVSGRRGLTHFNATSGRWKLFEAEKEEESIRVVGGMAWWSNVLIVACEDSGAYFIRMFGRDRPLSLTESLGVIALDSKPLLLSVFDSSLLVYTADNTFHHFLIRQLPSGATRLQICGSIGFEGVVTDPYKVRGMSWLVPKSQQRFGDPADDLNVATIIFLIQGQIVLLRPRRAAHEEVKYDFQILADRIEFYWTHLSGIGTLENSLWGWNGQQVRIWLDALTIEKLRLDERRDIYETVTESAAIALDFYPLAVLMDKGIIVGVDQETALRKSLDFAMFRMITTTHLFIPHVLRFHLERNQTKEAVFFASHYQQLVYFAHALEILLHEVLEDEVALRTLLPEDERLLPRAIEFLDHFDEALQVVVGCARKTEVTHWPLLFDTVGKPRDLFETCMTSGLLKVAASYLLVLHNLDSVEQSSRDTLRLLKSAMHAREWKLCRDLLSFLYSLDRTGSLLRAALLEGSAMPSKHHTPTGVGSLSTTSLGTATHTPNGSEVFDLEQEFHSLATAEGQPPGL